MERFSILSVVVETQAYIGDKIVQNLVHTHTHTHTHTQTYTGEIRIRMVDWDLQMQTIIYRMDKQQGPTV